MGFRSYADIHETITQRLDNAGISRSIWGIKKNQMSYLAGRGIRVHARTIKLDLQWSESYLNDMISGVISTIKHSQKEPIE